MNLKFDDDGNLAVVPVGRAIVAVVGQEVVVEFPEDVQCDSAVWSRYVVVGFTKHGVHAVQGQKLTEELVGHPVNLQQALQLLKYKGKGKGFSLIKSLTENQLHSNLV